MEQLGMILSACGTATGLLITTLTFLVKFIKNAKSKKITEQLIEIGNVITPYIAQAEAFVNYSGSEKKEFVMTKANQFAIENKIKFDYDSVSQKVEELVELTKLVNSKTKVQLTLEDRLEAMRNAVSGLDK